MSPIRTLSLSISVGRSKLLIGLRPRWLQHIANHKVLEDDQVFLHWQERVLERAGGSPAADRSFFMPNKADVYVAALHRWLNSNGGEPFAGELLPERQRNEDLMDRFQSHTKSCRSCSTALKRIRAARPWAWAVLWGAAALVGLGQGGPWTAIGFAAAAIAGLTLRQVSRWEKGLMRGDGAAPRNQLA
jgi:phenylpropionate dioxygenase-like ring-hydroxylating dioxygenase large terminal subunit